VRKTSASQTAVYFIDTDGMTEKRPVKFTATDGAAVTVHETEPCKELSVRGKIVTNLEHLRRNISFKGVALF